MIRSFIFAALLFVAAVSATSDSVVQAQCRDGEITSFDNGCNSCTCGNGNWACTLKICPQEPTSVNGPDSTCTDGDTTSFDNGCNTCTCTNKVWACTKKFCLDQAQSRSKRTVPECRKGDVKQEDCNSCTCTETGIWICTKRGCNQKREAIAAGINVRRSTYN